jgi:hypothetical protein
MIDSVPVSLERLRQGGGGVQKPCPSCTPTRRNHMELCPETGVFTGEREPLLLQHMQSIVAEGPD